MTRTPFVIPTRTEWIGLLLVIGTFGFFGQVRTPPPHSQPDYVYKDVQSPQMLLITGFQREAAGRASMGIYLLVS